MGYGQYCALARSLDVVGDRWTLLIVRELLVGAARYGEIQRGLPGVASNLLADRLRRLERDGIVTKTDQRYRLTPRGEALRPAIRALIRWGDELMLEPRGEDVFDPRWLIPALDALVAPGAPARIDLDVEGQTMHVVRDRDRVVVGAGPAAGADAVLSAPGEVVLAVAAGHLDLAVVLADGRASCSGDVTVAHALFQRAGRPSLPAPG